MSWTRVYWVVALVAAVALALSFGLHYGMSNQQTYLIHALVRFDPTLFPNDWYAREAADIHSMWSRVAALLLSIHDGPEHLVAIELVLTVVGCLAIAWLVRAALPDPREALPVLLGWYALAFVSRTIDVMGSFLFAGYLQPSSFGEAGILIAAACLAHRRHVTFGVALALGGLLHLNFLALGLASLGLAQLALTPRWPALGFGAWLRELLPRLARAFALPLLVFLWALPQFLVAAKTGSAEATRIVVEIRAPHHFQPTWEALAPFLAWQGAGWLALLARRWSRVRDQAADAIWDTLLPLHAGVGGFVVVCAAVATALHVDLVLQLFPFRFAPLASVIAAVAVLGCGVTAALRGATWPAWCGLGLAGAVLASWGVAPEQRVWVFALGALVAVAAALRVLLARRRPPQPAQQRVPVPALEGALVTAGLAACLTIAAAWTPLGAFAPRIHALPQRQRALVHWVRTTTELDDVFLVPPSLGTFRMFARRSVVVDWKSAGAYGTDILEWYRRINRVAGHRVRKRTHADKGYARMDRARAEELRREFGVRYLVLQKPRAPGAPVDIGAVAFENGAYVVYRLDGPAPPPGTP